MLKKIISLAFVLVMALSCCLTVSAGNTYNMDVKENQSVDVNLAAGDRAVYTFKPSISLDNYIFFTTGDEKTAIEIKYKLNNKDTVKTYTGSAFTNNACTDFDFTLSSLAGMTFTISAYCTENKASAFKFWYVKARANKSDFSNTSSLTYLDGIDVRNNNGNVEWLNGKINFENVSFTFRTITGLSTTTDIMTFSGNEALIFANSVKYESSKVVFKASDKISKNGKVSFTVNPSPIASVFIAANPTTSTYRFGDDGTIHGTSKSYYFAPDIKLEGMQLKITYRDDSEETLEVKKDAAGKYYVESETYGKIIISASAKVTENKTVENLPSDLYVGSTKVGLGINITKAGFFKMLVIKIKLIFGAYK